VDEAIRLYSEAIVLSEGCDAEKERAVFFANRAACHLALHAAAEVFVLCICLILFSFCSSISRCLCAFFFFFFFFFCVSVQALFAIFN
jgi:hypothetical protein